MAGIDEVRKHSFPPVVDGCVRVLIVGSLPGEASLAAARYYAHPSNQFWALMERVTGRPLVTLDYEGRLAALLAAGVGLWDAVASATRRGSLDGAIRGHSANDLAALAASLPSLQAVGFNGRTAAAIGARALASLPLALVPLPSSSPALTTPFEHKLQKWSALGAYLSGGRKAPPRSSAA